MTNNTGLDAYLAACRSRVEQALDRWLPPENTQPETLHQAMRYAALGNGKRIRPILVYAAGKALGLQADLLDAPACAVELIHAYSLVHDDLPAMDDDDLRRGRPTCHKAFDEATAILAGDALQSLAFQIISSRTAAQIATDTRLQMVEILARASGSRGMGGGQALDIDAVGKDIDLAQLENMHIHKTGALIRSCVQMGALAAPEANPAKVAMLDHYAKCIGLAFQVRDDILDVEGETAVIGKTRGKDAAADKPTYPGLLGLEKARAKAEELYTRALESLKDFGIEADQLRGIAHFVVERSR